MKTAIIIMAHPKFGSEEATARVFNAVALAEEAKCEGDEVEVTFIGTGTRWPAELSSLGHPANALQPLEGYRQRRLLWLCGCFRREVLEELACRSSRKTPSRAPGLASLRRYLAEGWKTMMF